MLPRLVLLLIAAASLLPAADLREFKKTVPLEKGGRLWLDTYKGSIRVTAWDQPQVDIQARIEPDLSWMTEPVDDVEIRVDASSGSVRIKSVYHDRHAFLQGNLPFVRYTIRMPAGASLSVKDYKSESDISGVQGDIEFDTYKGEARLNGLRGALDLKTYKGTVRASFAIFNSRSHVDTYRGSVELALPRSSAFEIHAQLERRATLDCDFSHTVQSGRREREFRGTVNGGGPVLRVTSYRGTIRIHSV